MGNVLRLAHGLHGLHGHGDSWSFIWTVFFLVFLNSLTCWIWTNLQMALRPAHEKSLASRGRELLFVPTRTDLQTLQI